MAERREQEDLCASRCTGSPRTDDEYLGNAPSPGAWEEDGDASEDEMDTQGGWQPVLSRDSSPEALDFSTTNRAKAERRLELSVTVNESSFGQSDSFGRQSDAFKNKEQTLLQRGHSLDEDQNDYMSSSELVAVPLGEDNDNEVDFDPVDSPRIQHSQTNQITLSDNFEDGNGVEQGVFSEAEEKRRKTELDELKYRKQPIENKRDDYASDGANSFEKALLLNDSDRRFECEDENRDIHKTTLCNDNESNLTLHKTELFNIAENGDAISRARSKLTVGEDEKSAALLRKSVLLKESVGFPMKRSEKKDFMSETRLAIKDCLPTMVDCLARGAVERHGESARTEVLDKGKIEKNRKVPRHEDLSADETQDIDGIESEATITAITAATVEKSSNLHRHTEALKSASNSIFIPGMKIKDEPLDEGYEKALAPQEGARIKDEPDSLQGYGQHSKSQESDIRISAVFSVSGSPLVSQLVQQNTSNALNTAKSSAGGSGQTASAPMSVRVTCSGCKKILKKGQTAYQRKGSTQLFCSTLCLTGLSASTPRLLPPPKKSCYLCNKEIMNLKDLVMGQIDGRGPYKEFCNHNCLFEMKRKSASTTNNITTKCSICQKVSVVRHEVNYQNVVHQLCSDICFSKFRMANNLTMNCCDNCGAYCYSGSAQCHMLQTEGQCKKFCGSACLSSYKQKNSKITPCTWCKCLRSSAEMIENTNSFGKAELFCSVNCLSAFRVHVVTTQGTSVQCNYCKVTMTPQYHLAMSDGSIRNFCSYNCVASFQGLFSQAAPGSQAVVPLSQGQLAVNIPSTASVVAGAPVVSSTSVTTSAAAGLQRLAQSQQVTAARSLIRLKCQYCQRLFSSKPELLEYKGRMIQFCGRSCCDEYKRINSVVAICEYCRSEKVVKETVKFSSVDKPFCSEGCKLLYKHDLAKRWGLHCKSCSSCSQSSKRLLNQQFGGKIEEFCSEECLFKFTVLFYQMAKCDCCKRQGKLNESIKWHGQTKHFCNLHCVLTFCNQHHLAETAPQEGKVPVPNLPSVHRKESTPVIANVMSLANTPPVQNAANSTTTLNGGTRTTSGTQVSTQTDPIRLQPSAPPKVLKNKALLCKPISQTKATSCRPHTQTKACQTEEDWKQQVIVLPIPVPVYIPVPLHLYSQFTPIPIGMPVPLPVPMFIPTTLDSADRIIETIQEIKEKIPSNPFEADLLTMAAMIAEEEEKEKTISHGDQGSTYSGDLESEAVSTPHSWEDELSNFTLKQSLASAPVPPPPPPAPATEPEIQSYSIEGPEDDLEADISVATFELSRRDRLATARQHRARQRAKNKEGFPQPRKRGRKKSIVGYTRDVVQEPVTGGSDVGLFLKYMYGVKAWKRWVQFRNDKGDPTEELRFGSRPIKLKEDILSCTAAELSYGLCQFIQEVRRPNGEKYEPDSIFYLCLGIQQYIFENSRIDNIFTDLYYTKFTSELTKALKFWQPQLLPSGQLFCRIEEEHLWECKQLGAYSPTVLLNTLLFFNTKYFQLKSVSEHMKLSFAHVMRCTKSLKHNTKLTYLRFFPPMYKKDKDIDKLQFGKRKRSDEEEEGAMEMAENTDNPLRCPVRLFEFYLSKCSESVKSRSDVFYLQPERSCVPDSPMWYSTLPTDPAILDAMLTRILMVREVHEELAKVNHEEAEEEDAFE